MQLEATPEGAITYMKIIVVLLFSWPPDTNAKKCQTLIFDIFWCICLFISIFLIIPLSYAAYSDRENILAATKSICLAIVCVQYVLKMFICKSQRNKFQVFINYN